MKGDKFKELFEDYMRKVNGGKWLECHAYDPRNADPIQTRIQLDVDSRTVIEYLKELKLMCNNLRIKQGLEIIK